MWWGDLQQQMELNQSEIERKARHAWMRAGDGCRSGWFKRLWLVVRSKKKKSDKTFDT